jgi:hypothetical protein
MPELPRELPHLYLNGGGRPEQYTSKGRGSTPPAPARDRALHAQHLQQAFTAALNAATAQLPAAAIANGIYLDFELPHGTQAFVEKLEDRRKHIELIAVTQGPLPDSPVRATVFVPSAAADHYQRKITAYQEQETKSGKPKNEPLIARINTIQLSAFRSVYTDDPNILPEPHLPTWWEVWLRHGQYEEFAHVAAQLNIPVRPQRLHFAEREVILALANQTTIGQLFINTQTIAEIRIARDNPTLFVQMNNVDQAAWVADLSGRLQPPPAQAPTVCILDSGITSAHPLLAPAIDPQDVHRYDPTWPAGDSAFWNGHGTAMSGIALYGNLQTALESQEPFALDHRLEAVTMLAPDGAQHEPRLYGAITAECIARAEIQAPQRPRVVCMAVTSSIDTLRGQPSSWSAAVDNICFGDNQNQQLLMISAGNIRDDVAPQEYPAANDTATIENPGQAWNALTVGAHTERVNITDPTYAGWTPIAPAGDLCPTSRTSTTWQRQWPIKPEIVMEGGDPIQEYRRTLTANAPSFLLARRFTAAESWTKATTQEGTRYVGLFREHEPDLAAILAHPKLLILGEPGAGKSTTGKAVIQHLQEHGQPNDIPVVASLKSYNGNLRTLLLQNTPALVLDAAELHRTYVLDGVDEVPVQHRQTLRTDVQALLTAEVTAKIICTARQAFYAQHPEAFPEGMSVFHLLDFDSNDIRACAIQRGVDAESFLTAVREADCAEEIRNPFVLDAMLKQYHGRGSLSPLRSENVRYVVDQLIQSRPTFGTILQRRALKMLAITCETVARNELTVDEALRVLHEAIEFPEQTARDLLDELGHSILIRTAGGISFQMRSYGEYLAAEELHDKSVERLKELAFYHDAPVDSWGNAITYLAEMNPKVRQYFTRHYPEWLVSVSPAAFTEDERTALCKQVLGALDPAQTYLVDHKTLSARRFSRLLTPIVNADLRTQLTSNQPHQLANALILLAAQRQQDIVPVALRLGTEHRNASTLRYSAIVALINAADNSIVGDLIAFAARADTYYINIIDAIGSICEPADFPRVLPLLKSTNAGLSSAFYHFRELTSKEALIAAIDYAIANPGTLDGYDLDSYLEPLFDLIPQHWGNDIAARLGLLLAALERDRFTDHHAKLLLNIIRHLVANDHDAVAVQSLITSLAADSTRLRFIDHRITPLITLSAAQWIGAHAREYVDDVIPWLPVGPARDHLAPRAPEVIQAQEEMRERYHREQQAREDEITTARAAQQHTIQTATTIGDVIVACEQLPKEHWPEISPAQRSWLAQQVNDTLVTLDLARSITWQTENQWTHPRGLQQMLQLTDSYALHLTNDGPIVLALRSWPDNTISNYYRREGLSAPAKEQLVNLVTTVENDSITRHALSFMRETNISTPALNDAVRTIALDPARNHGLRTDAIERLATDPTATDTLVTLATDQDPGISSQAFQHLIKRQHRATISRALATLTDDQLRGSDAPIPEISTLDWIGNITQAYALDDLKRLRERALRLNLWRAANIITSTIARIDKPQAAATIRQQLPHTPEGWQAHLREEANNLERAARIEAAQGTPFDNVIRKLKGATSMIRIKVWCEGSTDRPIFRKLFTDIGETEIAETLDFVGGWPNLLSEQEPGRWLDGCRQAIIIMDGDQGRKLNKPQRPLTQPAKDLQRRFANHPLKLQVLERYGIENYLSQRAYETVLGRNLNGYFPMPDKKMEDHFVEPQTLWQRLINTIRRRKPPTFYQKRINEQVAAHLTMADLNGTDLAKIINDVHAAAEAARQY